MCGLIAGTTIGLVLAASPSHSIPDTLEFSRPTASGSASDATRNTPSASWSIRAVYSGGANAARASGHASFDSGAAPSRYDAVIANNFATDTNRATFNGLPASLAPDPVGDGTARHQRPAGAFASAAGFTSQEQWDVLLHGNALADLYSQPDTLAVEQYLREPVRHFSQIVTAPSSVPEPSTLLLFGLGAAGLLVGTRRKKQSQ